MTTRNATQSIFQSMRQALTIKATPHQFGNELTVRVEKDFKFRVASHGFPGTELYPEVTIFAGSQIDNRDFTRDTVFFSHQGREYESYEQPHEGAMIYGLKVLEKGVWSHCDQVFAADDELAR